MASNPATSNVITPISVRYANFSSHAFITCQVIGMEIINPIIISFRKSLLSNVTIRHADAPNTFLMPISLSRHSTMNAASPNNPRHEISIANPAKYFDNFTIHCSALYYC